jgi:hypothetical protein
MKVWRTSILERVQRGDVVGIGILTGKALRGYEVEHAARERGAPTLKYRIRETFLKGSCP